MLIEICAGNLQSALNAQSAAAHRIELCSNLALGGTTPSAGLIRSVRQSVHLPIHVLIRPRAGDFCYTQSEIEVMRQDIRYCKSIGIEGIVIGLLTPDGSIDRLQMRHLIDLARPMSVTFHRAFDQAADPLQSLQQLMALGIDRLLTSGQQATAWEGRELISELVKRANGRLTILPGSGINAANILPLKAFTNATEFHLSAKQKVKSPFNPSSAKLSFSPCAAIPDYDRFETSEEIVRSIIAMSQQ
ncbi:MAG: copper homeostasis protein CutC [Bacteroidota bacterium]